MSSSRYRVLFELGEGGTATVHLAVSRGPGGFNKLVVLKALRRSHVDNADMRRLFLQEATLSARFNHPNIVHVLEVLEQDALPVIALEFLDGQTLDSVTRGDRDMPIGLHLHAITRVLRALEYAHDFVELDGRNVEIVHRDVSPHNVMLTYEGHVKLLDFGIAKLLSDHGRTETGVVRGKLRYMAPEQLLGEAVDRRADLFAVGVMLWQAACGERLWGDLSEAQMLHRIANGDIPAPTLRPGVPAGLEGVIRKALAPVPADRHQTAAELNAELAPFLVELDVGDGDRALGRYLSSRFAEPRARTRAAIDRMMREVEERAQTEATATVDFGTGSVPFLALRGSTDSQLLQKGAPPTRGKRVALSAALAVPLVAVAMYASSSEWTSTGGGGASAAAPVAAEAPAPVVVAAASDDAGAPAPREVTLRLTVFPDSATVTLDGEPVASNPLVLRALPDARERVIRAEAPGHEPIERTVRLDQDHTEIIRLPVRPQTVRRGRSRPSDTTTAAPDECTPPYYFDDRGIKMYRPQCFR